MPWQYILLAAALPPCPPTRYLDPDTAIGVIIGTGTNACYVERVDRVTKWQPDHGVAADARTCINIEWGAFDSPALPRCQEDWDVDAATVHKGRCEAWLGCLAVCLPAAGVAGHIE